MLPFTWQNDSLGSQKPDDRAGGVCHHHRQRGSVQEIPGAAGGRDLHRAGGRRYGCLLCLGCGGYSAQTPNDPRGLDDVAILRHNSFQLRMTGRFALLHMTQRVYEIRNDCKTLKLTHVCPPGGDLRSAGVHQIRISSCAQAQPATDGNVTCRCKLTRSSPRRPCNTAHSI